MASIASKATSTGKPVPAFDSGTWEALFRPASEAIHDDPLSMMIIGPQGSWKTSSLATIPKERTLPDGTVKPVKVLYLDSDQRMKVLHGCDLSHWTRVSLPLDPDNSDVVYNSYRAVSARMGMLSPAEQYDVIVLDTTTPLMRTLWDRARKVITDEADYSLDYSENKKRFGFVQQEAEKIIFSLKAACDLFVCISHEKEPFWGETDNSKKRYTADLTGSLKSLLPKLFQEVYFTYKNPQSNGDWYWLTGTLGQREGRNSYRLPALVPQRYDLVINRKWGELASLGNELMPKTPTLPVK